MWTNYFYFANRKGWLVFYMWIMVSLAKHPIQLIPNINDNGVEVRLSIIWKRLLRASCYLLLLKIFANNRINFLLRVK